MGNCCSTDGDKGNQPLYDQLKKNSFKGSSFPTPGDSKIFGEVVMRPSIENKVGYKPSTMIPPTQSNIFANNPAHDLSYDGGRQSSVLNTPTISGGDEPLGSICHKVTELNRIAGFAASTLATLPPLDFSNRSQYVYDNRPLIGPYKYADGSTYIGQYRIGKRSGKGKQIWTDGSVYEGGWDNDCQNGWGRLVHQDGDCYEGQWTNNKAEGKGSYTKPNGVSYVGTWRDDLQDGRGIETDPQGTTYEGEFYKGRKHGTGKARFSNGQTYQGEFQNNMMHGRGVYTWTDG